MGPLARTMDWSNTTLYIVTFLIGIGFGASLEMSGFGDSRKLTGQFYLRDMTVLKVMFGAVVMTAVLLGLFSSLGWIDMSLVWINPTYLWPVIVGGFVMGIGFMIGGFCPGTSLVAAATLKMDGLFFLIGTGIGIFLFGLTLPAFEPFWLSSYLGHFTLPELFHVSTGVMLLVVTAVGLFAFVLAELAEARFGAGVPAAQARLLPKHPLGWAAVGALILAALITAAVGDPTAQQLWARIAPEAQPLLDQRTVHAHPLEVAELTRDTNVYTVILDVRDQPDYQLFHLRNSRNVSLEQLADARFVKQLAELPDNTIFFTVSWDETRAVEAWKLLKARGLPNVYIVEGGINHWHDIFPPPPCLGKPKSGKHEDDTPRYEYARAVGDCCNTAYPELAYKAMPTDCYLEEMTEEPQARSAAGTHHAPGPEIQFTHKVKLTKKKAVTGGCG